MTAAEVLRGCGLLAGFTDTGIQILASAMTPRQYPAGSPLFVENMVSDALIVIADGRVILAAQGPTAPQPIGELGPGDWLGELSLVAPGQRLCSASAATNVTTFELRHADFQKLAVSKPQACLKLVMAICTQFGQKVAANRDVLRSFVVRG
jgi:CRP-like cAMP-binding protein